ncbi:hypothetical protein [Streptomyces sp. NBC_00385]|uniref:hypothetical protein n=1 Tax=Streptomyces sp. NBC_00385 TaxID=2975733 RepID=UPI002DDC0F53|nr:hypothetical protein [Streptomyces sp. NBC_00385]WRZ05972.1 hypothetical protein OG959_22815 [Streptomyces sp. NBC_00385]
MTPHPLLARRGSVLGCVSAAVLSLAVGCTSVSDGPGLPSASSSGRATSPESPSAPRADAEKRLGRQVRETLGTADLGANEPRFVEAGLERVGDGSHSEPELNRGSSYEVAVVCAGSGRITLSIALKSPVRRTVSCDGVPFSQELAASSGKVRIDTAALPGATGMVGWRVDRAEG